MTMERKEQPNNNEAFQKQTQSNIYNHKRQVSEGSMIFKKHNKFEQQKDILLLFITFWAIVSTIIAFHYSRPICNDLVRVKRQYEQPRLVCTLDLGNTQEDKANVIIVTSPHN